MNKVKNNLKSHLVRAKDVIYKDSENLEKKTKDINDAFESIKEGTFKLKMATTQDILDLFNKN